MIGKQIRRCLAFFSASACLVSFLLSPAAEAAENMDTLQQRVDKEQSAQSTEKKSETPYYSEKKEQYESAHLTAYQGDPIELDVRAFTYEGEAPEVTERGVLQGQSTPRLQWEVEAPADGLYCIKIGYASPDSGRSIPAVRKIEINGRIPFAEAEIIKLCRFYVDDGAPQKNALGDEVRPLQVEVFRDSEALLSDATEKYEDPFLFELKQGSNTIALEFVEEDLLVQSLALVPERVLPSYETYAAQTEGKPDESVSTVRFQAEDTERILLKNDSNMLLSSDSDPRIEPYSDYNSLINVFGGNSWRTGGQAVCWKFEVEQSGYYQIALRVKQNGGDGLNVTRRIEIDGRTPFRELLCYSFPFSRRWYTEVLHGESGAPYLVYLEKGEHELQITATTAERTEILYQLYDLISDISELNREIVLITGNEPDSNYDYELDELIPNLLDDLDSIMQTSRYCSEGILTFCTRKPVIVNNLETVYTQMKELRDRPDIIPRRLTNFTDAMTSVGNIISTLESTALTLDFFQLHAAGETVQDYHSSFFELFWASVKNLLYSFVKDYSALGGQLEGDEAYDEITVWVARGREWSEIIKQLSDSDFTEKYKTIVNVRLLPSGALGSASSPLLLAINAGNAPDAALGIGSGTPAEYAIRNALYDLSRFPDYEEVEKQFLHAAVVPFQYNGGTYALPETGSFTLMYVRDDIFDLYGLKIPETWDDVYFDLMPALNKNAMQIYIPNSYGMFLYQNGGVYYTEDGYCALNTPEAFESFTQLCELYTNLGVPVSANFFNRFRTGDMPIGIAGADMYMSLLSAAPELTGKWSVVPIPGTLQEDGTINRATNGAVSTAAVILANTEHPEQSWDFLSWWMSAETQTGFARTLEGQIGTASRWISCNLEALYALPWKTGTVEMIQETYRYARGVPVVPGDYFTSRHVNNAFLRVVNDNQSPRDALEEAYEAIDKEIRRRRTQMEINDFHVME